MTKSSIRNLIVILGDQLDHDSTALKDFGPDKDRVWMAEVPAESTEVWSHKARIVMFLSAMRHFRDELRQRGFEVDYRQLDDRSKWKTLGEELAAAIKRLKPEKVLCVWPGEYRVKEMLTETCDGADVELQWLEDDHFFCTPEQFAEHADGRKQLRMEYFYREMRKQTGVLMKDGQPVGGKWNFDAENRKSFSKSGPEGLAQPIAFPPDKTTRAVIDLVQKKFSDHPGQLDNFDWPVTADDAVAALEDFIEHRLPEFGDFQDAMWTDEPLLNHSLLSAAMNLKLLNPRIVVAAAEAAHHNGKAPLASVEGFIRQILGWREYVRGVYWLLMPEYLERNHLDARADLPDFYWTGETEMNCLRQAIGQTLQCGYAHHIQRLMVTGLFSLLLGVDPKQVHQWYLAVYVDAVEWVELPNTLGMSQYGDGGVMASKPYVATGKYIQRMSNYCDGCRHNPANATGDDACPFTTLYWDFLQRHRPLLEQNNRMSLQVRNLDRKSNDELAQITDQASRLKEKFGSRG